MFICQRITGRLSLQVGRPRSRVYHAPLAGPRRLVTWTASSSLNYQYRHLAPDLPLIILSPVGAAYSWERRQTYSLDLLVALFNRDWDGVFTAGYSRNQPIQQLTPNANMISPQRGL